MKLRVDVELEGREVQISTNLRRAPAEVQPLLLHALADHLGLPMLKARGHGPELPDPRLSQLVIVIEQARTDWARWGRELVDRVLALLDDGKLLPMTTANEAALRALFDDHRAAIVLSIHGVEDRRRMSELQRAGLVSPQIAEAGGYPSIVYRLGKGLDTLRQHEQPIPTRAATLEEALRAAVAVPIDAQDAAAIGWAQRRAGHLITRPVTNAETRTLVRLTDAEAGAIRTAVSAQIADPSTDLRRDLAAAVEGTDLQNDLDRIARTELAFAHGFGAYRQLKRQAAEVMGEDDPQVYRIASVNACEHCRRIWGPPTRPVIYRLSDIERREAQGGNVGIPADQWGPVIGPVHPNCLCSPMAYYRPEFQDAISRTAESILRSFGTG